MIREKFAPDLLDALLSESETRYLFKVEIRVNCNAPLFGKLLLFSALQNIELEFHEGNVFVVVASLPREKLFTLSHNIAVISISLERRQNAPRQI